MAKHYLFKFSFLCVLATSAFAYIEPGKYHDYLALKQPAEVQKMQDFHLLQAKNKIQQKQLRNAWGDLAYLLCQIPNHHIALQQMLNLAPQLHKENEMQEYLTKAVTLYPEDAVAHMLFGIFLYNRGDLENATKQLNLAKEFGELKTYDLLSENTATGQP